PYWSKRLQKKEMTAKQLSKRGGEIGCVNIGKRVIVSGCAVTSSEKNIVIN
ncbi:MAG: isomerase, partial [Formosa sp.]|nr:isomerase [Formosa sp.]